MSTPIRHAVILAHPSAEGFCAALADAYAGAVRACGQEAVVRDLYALGFDPVLHNDERRPGALPGADMRAERTAIADVQVFVLVYPVWFGLPPAMLIGYVERVLGAGATVGQVQHGTGAGVLTGCHLLGITTAGAGEIWHAAQDQVAALRTLTEGYLGKAFAMRSADHVHFGGIGADLTQETADEHRDTVRARARQICATLTV